MSSDPNILILSNVKKEGKPTGLQDAGSYFHTDYSYLHVTARATTLYSRVVPEHWRLAKSGKQATKMASNEPSNTAATDQRIPSRQAF